MIGMLTVSEYGQVVAALITSRQQRAIGYGDFLMLLNTADRMAKNGLLA